ncbi:MAG: hypothetical protein CFE23_09620 [Flavobacterium sp. BFFFF1]|uniref:hypothetical protein n=1 Tax=unclassified Flavobacterium TaxID=196869 RepID=UPI000BDBF774|nr:MULTISPECIES: hypothetical protein [unclassified Flavobacterium]OYU80316.1 MAG: hypothetical protein CFE23_09620 [Flavobacterium sp. BFFFF1]
MANRKKMIKELKVHVIPVLYEMNFTGRFPHFRRITPNRINLLSFHFSSTNSGFSIDLANSSPDGLTTASGYNVKPTKLTAHDFKNMQPIIVHPYLDGAERSLFRYRKAHLFDFNVTKKVCQHVIKSLHTANEFWTKGTLDHHTK